MASLDKILSDVPKKTYAHFGYINLLIMINALWSITNATIITRSYCNKTSGHPLNYCLLCKAKHLNTYTYYIYLHIT